MPLVREFQGHVVKRTMRVGDHVAVILKSPEKGQPGQKLVLPLAEYVAGLTTSYRPKENVSPQ
jgi:hypothetical protein